MIYDGENRCGVPEKSKQIIMILDILLIDNLIKLENSLINTQEKFIYHSFTEKSGGCQNIMTCHQHGHYHFTLEYTLSSPLQ